MYEPCSIFFFYCAVCLLDNKNFFNSAAATDENWETGSQESAVCLPF